MRLLERNLDGQLVLSEFTGKDVPVPAYAILSHTWATDNSEEVSFQDVESGTGESKAGYKKIRFCAERAEADGLRYFWIDTCCIDKRNFTELSEAINSMFRWYQNATRCYVYLSDVSILDNEHSSHCSSFAWEAAFRKSRWFTRGWTLQELLAPTLVDFYSLEGERLGSKSSLEEMIYNITGIARDALKGNLLSNFSFDERMSWAEHRNTKHEEDKIYSMLGIFDISMPLIYGEGREKAFRRLQEETNRFSKGAAFEKFAVARSLLAIPEPAEFVARKRELAKMHQQLYGHTTRSIVVLHGLGGIGKTQLAIAYAEKHKEKYTAIFWLNANDEDSLRQSFLDIAQQILRDHPSTSMRTSIDLKGNLDEAVGAVKNWLSIRTNTRWLMIYDNYDNPKLPDNSNPSAVDVRQFIPGPDHGSIIITTRSSQVTIGRRIHIRKLLNVEDGLRILSNTSGRNGISDDVAAIALVEELDGLPLALSTAGAYLEQVSMSFSEYLRLYKTSWLKLQMTSPQLNSYEDRSLCTTWQLSLDRIEQQNALSAKLLKLWAYFDRQDVWFELLRYGRSADDAQIQKLTKDELSFTEAVRVLCNYGLVDPDLSPYRPQGPRGYSMHSCVHSWAVFVLNREWDESLARLALASIASEIPRVDEKNWWLLQRRLLQHAARHEQFITEGKLNIEGMGWALCWLAQLYNNQGKLAEAEAMYTRALQGKEEALGLKHISILNTVNNLGSLYIDQGKLTEAEAMFTRALQGKEEALGLKHILTLDTVNNLGVLHVDQGKLAKAEAMFTRALQGYEETLGPELVSSSIPALKIMFNLGNLFSDLNEKAMAKIMYKRALSGFATVRGPSSGVCRELERRLEALDLVPVDLDNLKGRST